MHHLVVRMNKLSVKKKKVYQIFLLIADLVFLLHLLSQFINFPLQLTDGVVQHHFTSAEKHGCVQQSLDVHVWLMYNHARMRACAHVLPLLHSQHILQFFSSGLCFSDHMFLNSVILQLLDFTT